MKALQTAFQIDKIDNVVTALMPVEPGTVRLFGDTCVQQVRVIEKVPIGHKIALCDIVEGEMIIKYGVAIGRATKPIPAGSWVHLHVMRSNYDERSNHLNVETGAPEDTLYK